MSASNTQKPLQPAPTSPSTQQDFPHSDATMADAPDSPVQSSSQSPRVRKESVSAGSSEKSSAPGSSWNSKKFHEEYERAMSAVLDKDWDHTKYGDVLLN